MFDNVHTTPAAWVASLVNLNPWVVQAKFAMELANQMTTPSKKAKFTENNVDLDLYYYG